MTEAYVPPFIQYCKLEDNNSIYNVVDNYKQALQCLNTNQPPESQSSTNQPVINQCVVMNYKKVIDNNLKKIDQQSFDNTYIPCYTSNGYIPNFSNIDVHKYKFATYDIDNYPNKQTSNYYVDLVKTDIRYKDYDLKALLDLAIWGSNISIDKDGNIDLDKLKTGYLISSGLFKEASPKILIDYLESLKAKSDDQKENKQEDKKEEIEEEDEPREDEEDDKPKRSKYLYIGIGLLLFCLFFLIFGIIFMLS